MKTFILIAVMAMCCMSCTQYKIKRVGTSSPVEITGELDNGYKIGDTVQCHFNGSFLEQTCVIVDVIK